MPTPTYDLIASTTLAAATSSVTFSELPTDGTYRDLVLVMNGPTSSYSFISVRFNGDTGSNYNDVLMYGYGGASLGSEAGSNRTSGQIGVTQTDANLTVLQVMDYSATDKHKTWLSRSTFENGNTLAFAGRWANTAAINSVSIIRIGGGTFSAGFTANLFGIAS